MFSIRKTLSLAAITTAAGISGLGCCATHGPVVVKTPEPVAEQPKADEATEIRGFQKSVALYHSGATAAWPTRWYYAPNPDYVTPVNYVIDPIVFLFQTASLPGTLLIEPPFRRNHRGELQPVVYAGDVLPPSYNALPPLSPAAANLRSVADPDPLSAASPAVAPPLPPIPEERPPLIVPPPPAVRPARAKAPVPHSATTTRPSH